ncbi:MAG: sigma-70 family RNA polymerase sigma factor [Pseudomonadota bacterium]
MSGESQGHKSGSIEESALVARIAARDEAAFREVISRHAPMLHRIAYRMMGDAHEAEDIAQEAMLRLWDHAPRWKGGGLLPAAWLKRVTVNLAIDRLRVAKRISGDEAPEQVDQDRLADAQIETREEQDRARALIASLPDRQRAAIILTYYEELPNIEAANVLDMNIKAFESLLHRARAALRKSFEASEPSQARGGAA